MNRLPSRVYGEEKNCVRSGGEKEKQGGSLPILLASRHGAARYRPRIQFLVAVCPTLEPARRLGRNFLGKILSGCARSDKNIPSINHSSDSMVIRMRGVGGGGAGSAVSTLLGGKCRISFEMIQ